MAIKIDIKKSIETFEIGSKTYELEIADEKLKAYNKHINDVAQTIDDAKNTDTEKDMEKQLENVKAESRRMLDFFFGDGSYDSIFEETGKSTIVMTEVISDIAEEVLNVIKNRQEKTRQEKKANYYKKKNSQ